MPGVCLEPVPSAGLLGGLLRRGSTGGGGGAGILGACAGSVSGIG